jgi:integrase
MALSFFAGLRRGEMDGLEWGDIDADFIHVRRALSRGVMGEPKSKKSVRSIPIIAPVRIPLMLWKAKSTDGVRVFPISLVHLSRKVIRPTLEKNNLPWKGYHSGRRGLGTALRSLTGNSNAGRDLLGHTDEKITQEHYEAAMPEEVLRGMRLLEAKVGK